MDWQTSEDTVPSAPITEADARMLLGRPPATGAWRDGDPVGDRHFAAFGAFRTEGGTRAPGLNYPLGHIIAFQIEEQGRRPARSAPSSSAWRSSARSAPICGW